MNLEVDRGRSRRPLLRRRLAGAGVTSAILASLLAGCGGGDGSNPFLNPPKVTNDATTSGQQLSFVYFQKCINPVLQAQLQIQLNGVTSFNTCASGGCHSSVSGAGGALRISSTATPVNLSDPANTPELIRASDMYKNFFSSRGSTVPGDPAQSRLLLKPLLRGVLHGGGLIFEGDQDLNARLIKYWISRPTPVGQDEFGNASNAMFTPPDPATGACNTQ